MKSIDSHIVEYKKGEHDIRQWEKDSTIFVLLKGRLIITKNKVPDAELNTLNVGAMFGEVPLITGKTRWIIVIAKKKVVVLKMDSYILKMLIGRLDEMNYATAAFKQEFEKMYRRL